MPTKGTSCTGLACCSETSFKPSFHQLEDNLHFCLSRLSSGCSKGCQSCCKYEQLHKKEQKCGPDSLLNDVAVTRVSVGVQVSSEPTVRDILPPCNRCANSVSTTTEIRAVPHGLPEKPKVPCVCKLRKLNNNSLRQQSAQSFYHGELKTLNYSQQKQPDKDDPAKRSNIPFCTRNSCSSISSNRPNNSVSITRLEESCKPTSCCSIPSCTRPPTCPPTPKPCCSSLDATSTKSPQSNNVTPGKCKCKEKQERDDGKSNITSMIPCFRKKKSSSKTSTKSTMSLCQCKQPSKVKEEKHCKCRYPPAFNKYFECTGSITGSCCCAKMPKK